MGVDQPTNIQQLRSLGHVVRLEESDISFNAGLADVGEEDYVGRTKWWKQFHRSVFPAEGGVGEVEPPGRKRKGRQKSDIRIVTSC